CYTADKGSQGAQKSPGFGYSALHPRSPNGLSEDKSFSQLSRPHFVVAVNLSCYPTDLCR
ncbi:MAG: hypothetical protein ACK56F_07785, partial [bacterium]